MIRAIIFDLDGTLLDSVDLHAKAWKEAFQRFGRDIPFAEVRGQIGKGGDQLLPVFLSSAEIEDMGEQLQEIRSQIFKEKYLAEVRPFPMVRELFEKIERAGQRIAIASSAKGDELRKFERIAGIDDLVEVDTSSADASKSKPHPDIFAAALEKLGGIPKDAVMVVGDSPYDAEAAKKAGVESIGLLCGGFPEADLRAAGCIEIYDSPADLLQNYQTSLLGAGHASNPADAAYDGEKPL